MRVLGRIAGFLLIFVIVITSVPMINGTDSVQAAYADVPYDRSNYVYLSDLRPMYGKIPTVDLNGSGSSILLNINGGSGSVKKNFIKGVSVYAPSEYIYDLTASGISYDRFRAYIGIDARQISTYFNGGAKAFVAVSNDGSTWKDIYGSKKAIYGWDDAEYVDLDISNAKYLKIYTDANGSPSNFWTSWYDDVVYADAKLVKSASYSERSESTVNSEIKTLSEYDTLIRQNPNNAKLVLQREFVRAVGYKELQDLVHYSNAYKDTVKWLMDSQKNLEYYIHGGRPDGSYSKSLKILYLLREKFGNDLNDPVYGDLYLRMMITLSLTHAKNVGLWVGGANSDPDDHNSSNALKRYEIYKKLHKERKLDPIFDGLLVAEMRFVMDADIDDESIEWLNWYVTNKKGKSTNPYAYINYTMSYNYSLPKYYDEDNRTTFDNKYGFDQFGMAYKKGYPKLWVVWEEGSVCGGLSKTGTNIHEVFGRPAAVVGQPGHAAYIFMEEKNGKKYWNTGNDITGWPQSEKGGYIFNWGDGDYPKPQFYAAYQLLGQQAASDYENFKKAEQKVLIANSYANDFAKAKEYYYEAIKLQSFNLDAWLGLVNLYNSTDSVEDSARIELATDIADNLTYHPLAVNDLINLLKTGVKANVTNAGLNTIRDEALNRATKATEADVLQPTAAITVAKWLLGKTPSAVATFSFDGKDAGKIVLSDEFGDNNWKYSVDGAKTWVEVTGTKEKLLSNVELNKITDETDIAIQLIGVETIHTIDIGKEMMPEDTIYANDYENAFIGVVPNLEWKLEGERTWTRFGENSKPDLSGNKKVEIRIGRNGSKVASEPESHIFTNNDTDSKHKYIPVSRVGVRFADSEEKGYKQEKDYSKENSVDGNLYTNWQSSIAKEASNRIIILELTDTAYLSGFEYVPRIEDNTKDKDKGLPQTLTIGVSVNGGINAEDFTTVKVFDGLAKDRNAKKVMFEQPVLARYIRIEATKAYDNYFSAAMFNLFEDSTNKTPPTADIDYGLWAGMKTSQDVTVRLVNPSRNIKITNTNNPSGDPFEYTFTENGEFTFTYEDEEGIQGSTTAKVNWIDKQLPEIEIEYSTKNTTKNPVTIYLSEKNGAALSFWYSDEEEEYNYLEDVDWREDDGWPIKAKYTFEYNDTMTFLYVTETGVESFITVKVDWIDRTPPVGPENIEYSKNTATNESVEAVFKPNPKYYTVVGANSYTFSDNGKYIFSYHSDIFNVDGTVTATVDWIDKTPPKVAVRYRADDSGVRRCIIAEVYSIDGESLLAINNGNNLEKKFYEPGEYSFLVSDEAGNSVYITAKVDSLDDPEPEPEPEPESGQESQPESGSELEPEPGQESQPESGSELEPEPEQESQPEPRPEPERQPNQEPQPEPRPEPEFQPDLEFQPESGLDTESEPDLKPHPEPDIKPELKPEIESKQEVESEGDEGKKDYTIKSGNYSGIYTITNVKKREVSYRALNKNIKEANIPNTITIDDQKFNVTSIEDDAFKGNKNLKSIRIGDNIKVIGKRAFYGCKKLNKIYMGKNVTEIKANAFRGCTSITYINIKKSVNKIGSNAFYGTKKLKSIKVDSKKMTKSTIAKNAFKGMNKKLKVTVPKSKAKTYKKLFKSKGLPSSARIRA